MPNNTVFPQSFTNQQDVAVRGSNPAPETRNGPPQEATETVVSHRLQISLSEPFYERVMALKKKTDAPSVTAVIRNALRFYEGVVDELQDGKRLIVEDPKNPMIRTRLVL